MNLTGLGGGTRQLHDMSGIPNMNEWEDDFRREYIEWQMKVSGQKQAVREWDEIRKSVKYHKDTYIFNRELIDKDIAKLKRSYFR